MLIDPNVNRVREIRKTVFGKPMREPIARSLEKTHDALRRAIVKPKEDHANRVTVATTTKISGNNDYYTLGFTRANGE